VLGKKGGIEENSGEDEEEEQDPGPHGRDRRQRQEKSRAALGGGEIQRVPGLTIVQIVIPRGVKPHTQNG
jgi:hypothetical protein